jgi:hypothetical protein
MIYCKKCNSINIAIIDKNFAHLKKEHCPAVKLNLLKIQYHCRDCESDWNFDPKASEIYSEYIDLKHKTALTAHDMKHNKTIHLSYTYINGNELMRRKELAKILFNEYKSHLNLNPENWHDIEFDAK